MKFFLAVVACLVALAVAGPGMGSSSMYGGQDTGNQIYRDPSTGRTYTQDQVHQALEAMFGYNNQMMFDTRQQSMPYQQYNTNSANRG